MSVDPQSDAMWADLHAAEARRSVFGSGLPERPELPPVGELVPVPPGGIVVVFFARQTVCDCPPCRAARFAQAGCDACADLGYGPCADHQEPGC